MSKNTTVPGLRLDETEVKANGTEGLRALLTFKIARTQASLNAQASHLLRQHSDLTLVEWRVIQLLSYFKEAPMSMLAAEAQIDKGQLSRRINTMIKKGLIEAEQDAVDQRRQILRLTQKSNNAAAAMRPIMEERQKQLREDISPEALDTFMEVLDKIERSAYRRARE